MPRQLNRARVSRVLAEALLSTDAQAARNWGVHPGTIRVWKKRMAQDIVLQKEYAQMVEIKTTLWAQKIPTALEASINFVLKASEDADHTDPQTIAAVTEAISKLVEIQVVLETLQRKRQLGQKIEA